MNETEFNKEFRETMRYHGMSAVHVKEADIIGVFDIILYHRTEILAWIELKVQGHSAETSQNEFSRNELGKGIPCFIADWRDDNLGNERILISRLSLATPPVVSLVRDWRIFDWAKFFGRI